MQRKGNNCRRVLEMARGVCAARVKNCGYPVMSSLSLICGSTLVCIALFLFICGRLLDLGDSQLSGLDPVPFAVRRSNTLNEVSGSSGKELQDLEDVPVVKLTKFDYRLSNKLEDELQKLRCHANYQALKFTEPIAQMGQSLVERIRKGGRYIALLLRFEPDMLAFTGCYYGGGPKEIKELGEIRKRWRTLGPADPEKARRNGKCPLSPTEISLLLRASGFGDNTHLYVASGEVYGGEEALAQLKALFPKFYTKDSLSFENELKPFKNYSSRMAAIDYIVCDESDVFVANNNGNMAGICRRGSSSLNLCGRLVAECRKWTTKIDRRGVWSVIAQAGSGSPAMVAKEMERVAAKEALLLSVKDVGGLRGLSDPAANDKANIDVNEKILNLERLNPTPRPTTSPVLEGLWQFEWAGAQSPGIVAARILLGRFPSALALIDSLTHLILDGSAEARGFLKVFNTVKSSFTLVTKLTIEGPLKLKEEYAEGLFSTPKVTEGTLPSQLKGVVDQLAATFDRLPDTIKDVFNGGVKFPLTGTFSRELIISYLDEEVLVARDKSIKGQQI